MSAIPNSASAKTLRHLGSHRRTVYVMVRKSEHLLTVDELARYLNVDKFTVYRLISQDKQPAFKVGNQWRFKQELIDAWLQGKLNTRA